MVKEIGSGHDIRAYVSTGSNGHLLEIEGKFESMNHQFLVINDATYRVSLDGKPPQTYKSSRVEIDRSKLVMYCSKN